MKVLGIGFGTKLGNTEVMVKEALMAAEEMGAEVAYISGLYLNLIPCNGCRACFRAVENGKANYTHCIMKDDVAQVQQYMLNADAIIFGSPVWALGAPAALRIVFEKSHIDLAYAERVNKERAEKGGEPVDPRVFKPRPIGIISQGGSSEKHWTSMNTQSLSMFGISLKNTIVDIIDEYDMTRRMGAVGDKELLERCRLMGKNVVTAAKSGEERPAYLGDLEGVCPVCHLSLLRTDGTDRVMCPQCGIYGKLTVTKGRLSVAFPEDMLEHTRMRVGGLADHQIELQGNLQQRFTKMKEQGITNEMLNARKEKYRGYADIKIGENK